MAMPMSRGRAVSKGIAPVTERAWTIPTAAEADCRIAVKTVPTRIPSSGLDIVVSMFRNQACSPSSETEPLIYFMPIIRTEKPIMISPMWWCSGFLENMRRKIPTTATMPVSVVVERMSPMPEPVSR